MNLEWIIKCGLIVILILSRNLKKLPLCIYQSEKISMPWKDNPSNHWHHRKKSIFEVITRLSLYDDRQELWWTPKYLTCSYNTIQNVISILITSFIWSEYLLSAAYFCKRNLKISMQMASRAERVFMPHIPRGFIEVISWNAFLMAVQ